MSAPLPPHDIASRSPSVLVLATGTRVERIFSAAYAPIHFDKTRSGRLNAPDGSFGVLYAAESLRGAFAETFLRKPGLTLIAGDEIARKARAQLQTTRELKLVALMGAGLAQLGATAEVTHGGLPYDAPQQWAAALYAHPGQFDGIAYRSRHDDDAVCYAFFDRTPLCIAESGLDDEMDLTEHDWFWDEMDRYRVGFAPAR